MIEIKVFYDSLPDFENRELSTVHNDIFNVDENLNDKLPSKNKVMTLVAYNEGTVVGYKIGYEKSPSTFYSWLGGVAEEYRKHGIAQKLMDRQIEVLKEQGYKSIQTKTFNKWKSMLILNIKNDFKIIDTISERGDLAIILERNIE